MNKILTKHLFLLSIFTLLILQGVFAQTITVGAVDAGPYSQGATIAVPINVNDAGGCIGQSNTFNVYLSNASGNFSPGTLIGSYTGFYAGFVNATIPAGTPVGSGYKVEVQSTSPAVTSSVSSAFAISASSGVTATVTSTPIGSDPNIFGRCIGINGATFSIKNTSSTGTTTASFLNEKTQGYEASNISIPTTGYTFTAAASNYTIVVKNADGSGNVATKGYQLINNVIQNNFGSAGNGFVCLASGQGVLSYTISTTGPSGIAANYPGNTYVLNWGDGTSSTFTECQIAALGGVVSHTFILPSCGQTGNGVANSFYVQNQAFSPYCGEVSAPPGISAKVLITPITSFAAPTIACSGTALTIPNTSQPGPDPNATTATCTANPGALYDWTLDGVSVAGYQGVPLGTSFVFPTGTTSGTHTLTLHSELPASGIGCQSADYTQTICFEKPPQPAFTIAPEACAGTTVTPVNTSVASNICSVATYAWTVTGPGTATYTGGTTSTSQTPKFVFPVAGTYTVQLGMLSGCGTITTTQTINIDASPVATLSAALTLCGSGQTLTFSPTQTVTKTTFGGTTVAQATTYAWTVTGGSYSFAGGTNANSEYPQILFNDLATYTVAVTNTNTCGSTFALQKITFGQAPIVNAGPDQTVCASSPAATLAGAISGTYSSYQWTGGAGTFSPSRTVLNPVYTASTGEIAAGSVTLTLQGNASIPAPCNIATDDVVINFTPTPSVTSATTAAVCSAQALSYTITANQPLTTFAWTASATTGTPTGFTAVGSGSSITDIITNTGATDEVVKYLITPTLKGCPGPVFTLKVTIHPLPTITAAPVASPICSNLPANITLSSNVANTKYTWTSTASAGITGNTNQATVKTTTSIQDVLVNTNANPGTVTYIITPYNGTCAGPAKTTSITVEPSPVISNAGPDNEICNATSYTLQGNSASPGTGLWTVTSGIGTIIFSDATNPNAVVSGLAPGNIYQFQWTTSYYVSCPSSTSIVKITDDTPPVGGITAGASEVCSGSNGASITLSGQSGTILRWESSIDGGASWQPIANTTTSLSYSNLTQTTQFRAVIHNGVCTDVPSTATQITVDAPPVVANAGPDAEVCSVTTYTLQGNNPSPGTGAWTLVSGAGTIIFSNATNPNAIVSGLIPGNTYQFQWTITATGTCPINSKTVTIIDDKNPVGGTTSGTAEVCTGSNNGQVTLSGQFGTVVRWESSIDGTTWVPIVNTGVNQSYTNITQTTQYRAILHNGSVCADVPSTATTITVDTPPVTANAGPANEVCNVTTYTLQGNNPSPGTGKWTIVSGPAGATFSDATKSNAVVSGLVPGNTYGFQWTIKNTGVCAPSTNTVNIVIDSPPIGGSTSGAATVCIGSNGGQITLTGQTGSILRWESSVDGGTSWQTIANTGTNQSYLNLTQTTQYRAIIHSGVCTDVPSTPTIITVMPLPVTSVPGSDDEVCSTSTYTLHGNSPSPGTGLWTVLSGPSGTTFSNATSPGATVSGLIPGNTYQFQWTITGSSSCPPSSNSVNITIDKSPVGGTTSSNTTVCTGSNVGTISLAGQFGTILRWESSIDGGTTWQPIANNGTSQSYLNLTQTTEYRAILHNGVCTDVNSTPTIITVAPLPVASVPGPNDEVCGATTYSLHGNNPSPATGLWTILSGPAGASFSDATNPNAIVSGLTPGIYHFQWTITGSSSCPSNSNSVTITIDQPPVGGTTSSDATVCIGTNAGQITLAGQFGTIVRWEMSVDNGTTWQPIANTSSTQPYSALTQTTQYRAILHNSSTCADAASTITTITVAPMPIAAIAGANDEVCGVTSYGLHGNNPSPGTGLWTEIGGPAGVTFSDATNSNAIANGLIPGNTYQFQWTITTSASCPSTNSTVTIKIDAPPIGGTATATPSEVCYGSNGGQVVLTGQFGTIFGWQMSTDNGATWQPIGNSTTTQSFTNLTQNTEYRVILHNSTTCADVFSTPAIITVDPMPVVSNPGPNAELCNVTSYALQGNNPSPGAGKWTVTQGPVGATFSDAANPTAIVSGLIPGNLYQFKWTITSSPTSTCAPSSNTVNITIDAPAVAGTTSGAAEVCSGSNGGTITLSGQVGSVTQWESSVDNGVTWQPVANATASLSYLNLTQTTQYRADVHNGVTCPGVISNPITIVVDLPPTTANAGSDDEVCSVTTYTLHGNSPGTGTGKWTVNNGPAGAIFSDATNPAATVSGLVPGNIYQFKWTITGASTSCPPSAATVNITIDKAPVGGTTASNTTVCSGSNAGQINLSGQFGTILRWESSIDGGATWVPVANTNTTQAYSNLTQTTAYRAVLHNSNTCADVTSSVTTITVANPPVTADAGTAAEVCSVTTYTLQGNNPAPATGKWTIVSGPAGATFVDNTNPNAIVNGMIPGVYQFKWTITGSSSCPPSSSVVVITNDQPPVGGTTSSNATVCSGSNTGLITLNGQFGSILRWEFSTDGGTTWQPIANTNNTQAYTNLTQTTEYRAVLHNSSTCADATSTLTTITVVNPPVTADAGTAAEVCSVTTYTLQGNNPAPATGKWTIVSGPAGATFVDDTNPNAIVNGMIPGVYQFKWTITGSSSCPPSSSVVIITNDQPPVGGTTASNTNVCSGSNAGLITLSGQFGAILRWEFSIDGGTTWQAIANTNNTQHYTNLTQTTEYRAVLHNSSTCADATSTITTITVDAPPVVANAGNDAEVCNVTTYALQGNSATPGRGLWTVASSQTGVVFSDATNPNAIASGLIPGSVYQFKWTITGAASCPPTVAVVNITIDKAPVGGTTSSNAEVCSGSNGGSITLAGQFGTIVRWESSTDNGVSWQPVINTTASQSYSNLTQTTEYRAVLHNGSTCADVTSSVTIITVDTPPVVANAGSDAEVCSVITYALHANSPIPGTGLWTISAGPAGATFSDATNPDAVVSGLIPGSVYQFKWTITGTASCPPSSAIVNITIDKAPVGGTTSSPKTVCSGSNTGQIALAGQFGNIVRWEYSTDNGTTWQPISNTSATQSYSNLTQTTEYRAVLHNSSTCADVTSTTTTITVDLPPPVANAGSDAEVCNVTTYALHGDSPAPGTGLWTVNSGPSGATFSDPANPNAIVSGLIPGSVYQFKWTITGSASCPPSSAVVNITIDKPPVGGTTSSNATVCSGSNAGTITLAGQFGTVVRWESSIDNGVTWQPIGNTGTSQAFSNLTQTTQYRAVLHNSSTCADVSSSVTTITVDAPPVVANAGADAEVCGVITYTLNGNSPGTGVGLWTVNGGPAGTSFVDATNPNTAVNGLIPGSVYQFKWTITGSASCPSSSSVVNITIDKPPVGGTTASNATVCSGSNAGTITLSGQFGTVVRWESSTDNGATWQPIGNTGASQAYSNLTQTTQYRAVLHNSSTCADVSSSVTTITVNAPPVVANAGADAEVCGVLSYTLTGNSPGTGTGLWSITSGPAGTSFADATNPNTSVNGLVPGSVYQFKWTITGSASCPSSSAVVNITIDKPPVGGTTATNATVCSGSNTGAITLSGQFGTVVRWESSTDNGATWQPISNTGGSQGYSNLTQTTQYRAVLHNSSTCADVTSSVTTITVDMPPVVANAGTDAEVCNVTTYTLHGNSPGTGVGAWTINNGVAGVTFVDATNPNATVNGLVPGSVYQFKWTITGSSSCPPSSSVVNITIDKPPVGGTTASNTTVCSGSNTGTITLSGQFGTVVQWETSIDGGTTWQPIANTSASQSYTNLTQTTQYRADVHNSSTCADVTSSVTTITVVAPPTVANAGADDEVCSVTTYALHGNSPTPGTGLWTVNSGPAGVTFSDPTNPNATVNGLIPGNVYQFKWTITGSLSCPPSSDNVNITIDKAPLGGTTSGAAEVCSGSNSGSITLAGQFGTVARWEYSTNNGSTWTPVANTSTTLSYLNLIQTTEYHAVIHNSNTCADVTSTPTIITVDNPPPVANAGPGAEVCNVITYTLQGNNPAPATGKWTIFSGATGVTFSDDTNPNAIVSGLIPGNAYQFKWTITGSASCPSSSSIVTIIIDQPPVGGTTSGTAEVCSGSNGGSIALTGQFGTIVRWESSTDNGTTWQPIANTNATQSYFNLTQTTEFRAVLHNSATCADVTSTATTITVDTPPVVANAGPADEVCSVTTYTLRGNNAGTGIGQWTVVSGPAGATFSNPAIPNAIVSGLIPGNVYQFQWTITGSASCPPSSDIVNITIDKAPIGGTTSSPAEVCSGSNTGQINLLGQFGTIVRWESSVDGGATWQPISNSTAAQAYFNLTITTQYRAVLHNSSTCADVTSTTTTITVDQPPVMADAGADDEVCSVTTYTLNGNNTGSGTGKWTVFNGPAGAIFSDVTSPSATVSGLIPGNVYQFEWTITGTASCPPTTDIVAITIDKAPIGGTTGGAAEVCSGSNNGQVTLSGQFGTIVRWEFSTDNGATWQPIANTNNTQRYSNLTQTTQYRAVLHNSSTCADVTSTATTITVDTPPIAANAGADAEVCSVTTYNLNGNNPTPGTGLWTVESGPLGVTFSDPTNPNAIASGLIPGNFYQFKWTITGTASCPPTSDLVNITIDKAPIGGTTAGATEVCSGSNNGTIILSGQFGSVVGWEMSTNNGATWQPIVNTGVTQSYANLIQTTQYRVIIHSSNTCADVRSTATIITVDTPPVQADAGSDEEVCSVTSYNLNGNNPAPGTGLWTVLTGPAGVTFSDPTSPTAVANGMIPGNVYQFQWTITGTASCPPTTDIVSITDDKAPLGGTTTGSIEVCSGSNSGQISLTGQYGNIIRWEFSTDNGATWQPLSNTNNTQHYSNLTQTTEFRGVVQNGTICTSVVSTETTVIVNSPPVASVPGPNDVVCNVTSYTLHGNNPAPGTGMWSVVQGPAGVTFSDPTNPDATANGLIPGNIYVFKWTITGSASCPPSSAVVSITIDKAPLGGTTSSPATVCWGSNVGQITLTGQFGTIIRWESSIDNGGTWQPIANLTTTQTYLNLTRTTQYHAILRNGTSCGDVPSTVTTITVNDPTPASDAGQDFSVCNQTIVTLNANYPGAGGGLWTQTAGPAVNILTPSNFSTQVTGLSGDTTYTFKWTIFGLAPCGNTESTVNVTVHTDIVPSFTMNKSNGCGPTIVAFTNTSTPTPKGAFVWNFGDGSPSVSAINPPAHTFPPSSDGTEKTYEISLTPMSNCGSQTPFVAKITVSSLAPVAALVPSQSASCGTFALTAKNLSPGDNVKYDFYLIDQNGAIVEHLSYPDKEDAVFQPVSPTKPTTYELYMIVTDKCGNQAKSTPVDILGAPSSITSQVQIKGDIQSICLGSPVTFENISTGGDKFTITIYDANKNMILTIPSGAGDFDYTPTAIGTYYVSITAGYTACGDAPVSAFKEFTVFPVPEPSFLYTSDQYYNVTFVNTTPDAGNVPASSLIYKWDFGDGSPNANTFEPSLHHFDFANNPYVVTLTATIPGASCMGITTQTLDVKFHGNVFVPNAFMPTSSKPELRKFYVKGYGMKVWHMQVFNNFGQLLWESTALDSNGAPIDGWDGTYKGKVVEQGVYIWQCSGTLLNGEEWKGMSYGSGPPSRTGPIHLIR